MANEHLVVSREEWLIARKALLLKEKEVTRLRDKIRAERLELPWVKVEKEYVFDTTAGKKSLAELFDGRSQLMIYHFMFDPEWDAGCPHCSFLTDHIDGTLPHLEHHDVTLTAVSRAPLAAITEYKKRMGWKFPWVSSFGSDFNRDHQVSFTKQELASGKVFHNFTEITVDAESTPTELPGLSAFYKDESGNVFHTYSSYARGNEDLLGTLMILDRAPKGRNEIKGKGVVRRHDEYESVLKRHDCCAE